MISISKANRPLYYRYRDRYIKDLKPFQVPFIYYNKVLLKSFNYFIKILKKFH